MSVETPEDKKAAPKIVAIHEKAQNPQPSGSSIDDVWSRFRLQTTTEQQREDARTHVLKNLIATFSWCVVCVVLVGLVEVLAGRKDAMIDLRAIVDFLSVLMVPIITLVLGFYFGSEKR